MPMTAVPEGEAPDAAGVVRMETVVMDPGNGEDSLFGGDALCLMGRAALAAARRHTNAAVAMARTNDVRFHQPVPVGHILELTARVIHTRAGAMTVLVDGMVQARRGGRRTLALSGYFQMVTADDKAHTVEA